MLSAIMLGPLPFHWQIDSHSISSSTLKLLTLNNVNTYKFNWLIFLSSAIVPVARKYTTFYTLER